MPPSLAARAEQAAPISAPPWRRLVPLGDDNAITGNNQVSLLSGGEALFPAMCQAIEQARHEVWLATYIFHDDPAGRSVADALAAAARRGVRVGVVVDGFGSKATLYTLRQWLAPAGVQLSVFRPVDRWWRLLQPGQMRRLHQKLCVIDGRIGFVGGINVIDDRHDLRHGWSDLPRLDFAVALQGPVVAQVEQAVRAIWSRATLGADWPDELRQIVRSGEPMARARRVLALVRAAPPGAGQASAVPAPTLPPVRVAFVMRDNLRRRAIEQAYVQAISRASRRVDIVCPYFYPGRLFRRALRKAARRGVQVRLVLQGKLDYRFAGLAARVLYQELLAAGVQLYEYTPAFLHAKVAVVDDDWATVGSSNIDPLSLLLNLEANAIVHDPAFAADLARAIDGAVQVSAPVLSPPGGQGWWAVLRRGFVAWTAYWFLRLAGISGRY